MPLCTFDREDMAGKNCPNDLVFMLLLLERKKIEENGKET
jgi:hypothetical protein